MTGQKFTNINEKNWINDPERKGSSNFPDRTYEELFNDIMDCCESDPKYSTLTGNRQNLNFIKAKVIELQKRNDRNQKIGRGKIY